MGTRANRSMTENIDDLSPDGKILLAFIKNLFEQFTLDFRADFSETLENVKEESRIMKNRCDKMEEEIRKLSDGLDASDQYEKKDQIILSGPGIPEIPENPGDEKCEELVKKLLKDHLNVDIELADISTTHRLGPVKRATPRKRNITVKLCRRDLKKQIIIASKSRRTNATVFANESLTPIRRTMFHALRRMHSDETTTIKGCTTLDGKIYAFTPPIARGGRDQKHYIPNMEALHDFCRTYVKKPLDAFLQSVATH